MKMYTKEKITNLERIRLTYTSGTTQTRVLKWWLQLQEIKKVVWVKNSPFCGGADRNFVLGITLLIIEDLHRGSGTSFRALFTTCRFASPPPLRSK